MWGCLAVTMFGVRMVMHLHVLPWYLWLAETVGACFFTMGFVNLYQRISRLAFPGADAERTAGIPPVCWRILLMVMSISVGIALHFSGYIDSNSGVLLHDMGILLLTFPLLDEHINGWEVAIRAAGAYFVWLMHYTMAMFTPKFWIAMTLLTVIIIVMRRYHKLIRYNFWLNLLLFNVIAITFWTTIPPFTSYGNTARILIIMEAVVMFVFMGIMTALFWTELHYSDEHAAQMTRLVRFDPLTNTGSYADYQHDIEQLFANAKENGTPLTMVAIDIDHFKQVNDHYGHLAGNAALVGITQVMDRVLNEAMGGSKIYRTGGEEFNILFPGRTAEQVLPIMNRVADHVRSSKINYADYTISTTLSCGITAMCAADKQVDDLYARADDYLYQSKRNGRDVITDDGVTQRADRPQRLLSTYSFYTQRVFAISGDSPQVIASEMMQQHYDFAHDRWEHNTVLQPTVHSVIAIMRRLLQTDECRQITFNETTMQFLNEDSIAELAHFLAAEDGPDGIAVEISALPTLAQMQHVVPLYHAGGVRVAIDFENNQLDFEEIWPLVAQVDAIKLNLHTLRDGMKPVELEDEMQRIFAYTSKHDVPIIMDGVETNEDADYATKKLHARFVQGYYFDRPELPRMS